MEIRTGDKVYTSDGRSGKVTSVCHCSECEKRGFFEPTVTMRDGTQEYITFEQMQAGFPDYYLIGRNMIGNKVSVEEMERRIEEQREVVRKEGESLDALRKQLWTLNEQMVPDWRERAKARKKKKEEKESSEQID